MKKLKS